MTPQLRTATRRPHTPIPKEQRSNFQGLGNGGWADTLGRGLTWHPGGLLEGPGQTPERKAVGRPLQGLLWAHKPGAFPHTQQVIWGPWAAAPQILWEFGSHALINQTSLPCSADTDPPPTPNPEHPGTGGPCRAPLPGPGPARAPLRPVGPSAPGRGASLDSVSVPGGLSLPACPWPSRAFTQAPLLPTPRPAASPHGDQEAHIRLSRRQRLS